MNGNELNQFCISKIGRYEFYVSIRLVQKQTKQIAFYISTTLLTVFIHSLMKFVEDPGQSISTCFCVGPYKLVGKKQGQNLRNRFCYLLLLE